MRTKNTFTRLLVAAWLLVLALTMAMPVLAQSPAADLSVTATVDQANPFDGDLIVFSLTVTNNGPDAATGVSVADTLPAGVTYVSDDGAGAYASGVWTIGGLAASSSATLNITATVDANTDGSTIVNTAVVSGAEADPDSANNMASATISVRINDLCARTGGSLTLPVGPAVAFWGYAPGNCTSGNPPQLPGPTLVFQQGETVSLTLHNNLAAPTGIKFSSSGLLPDRTGAAVGGSKTYTFVASQPGTFLYEAAVLPNAQHQGPMGLFGAMIVRPSGAPSQALSNPATAFDSEAVVVLSEIDPALNNSAAPDTFDMRKFKPKYWLINGKAYPQTSTIMAAAGQKVLLRYLNAGQQPHSMAILGMNQQFLALDGIEMNHYRLSQSQLLMPGQTADAIATVPTSAADGAKFPFYETGLMLHNNGAAGFGGMLTFLEIQAGAPGGDTVGPAASGLALSPNPTNGSADVLLTATLNDSASGGSDITAAEYFIGAPGTDGTGLPLSPVDVFDSPTEAATATILAANLPASSGSYSIYVHGQDAAGNWGAFNFIVLNLDKTGPATSSIVLTPAVSNGSVSIAIQATGNDTANGGSNVVAAEYFIDAAGADGTGTAMAVNAPAPIASLNGTIPANSLAPGSHTMYIHSQDSLGNWGALAGFVFTIDQTGPTTSNVRSTPAVSNGSASVRVDALVTDGSATVTTAELFIDTAGAPGTGLLLMSLDGSFNELTEDVYGFIPQAQVNALSAGAHTILVRGKDSAGNWGTAASGSLTIDKVRPTVSTPVASPNPTAGAATITLTSTASDAASNITAAEWYRGTDPGLGRGTPMSPTDGVFDSLNEGLTATISTTGLPAGNQTFYVRAKDAAGNWSLSASTVVVIQANDVIFADSFGSGNTALWNGGVSGPASVTAAASMAGTPAFGMQVAVTGNTPGFVTDLSPVNETSYHARFYFNPRGTLTGNTQMDIFAARNALNGNVVRVQYRRTTAGGGTYQVRLSVNRAGGVTNSNWITIANNTAHYIELDWQSAASATIRFYVDGVLQQTLTGLNTSTFTIDRALLGATGGLVAASSGTPYFDQFESRRSTYIGP
jgi:uncharacterized repeat protein (TIGR01451 family)